VALKLLPLDLADDPERVQRFEEEARAASALSHPSIVTIYDAGQIGHRAFISMELAAGETLREILRPGAMPLRKALHVAAQLAEGLAIAHEARLVHRDLKPENIKVSRDGFVKILDFGLAKRIPARAGSPTW
jgi:serine/threonine protein kinase